MTERMIAELAVEAHVAHVGEPAHDGDVTVFVDDDGRPTSALGPRGSLEILSVEPGASLDQVTGLLEETDLIERVLDRTVLVVLVADDGTITGVVPPRVLASALIEESDVRSDPELHGQDDVPVGTSVVYCEECGHPGRYREVEPGITRCVHGDHPVRRS
ncbi:hypothetical protein BZB76_5493 [Actinomadura pelletieri DSM 43383]|uniref:CBS domain-containing protein n=1 Tax=Actinomadura pelletieri DSM 43383 TaxID=1120940 RepID=A0A495QGG4_9ACTN|nr:hypothetical protein [Actinomadura pelletieri]RKS71012.1 hypothetical protein BZB76_5493 [Actinomadura pelletieri DSM 43383]